MRFSTWNATLLAAGGNGKLVKSIAARGRTPYYTSRCWRGLVSCSAVQEEVVAARGSRPTAWGVWRRCSGTYRRRRGARGRCSPSTEKLHLRYGDERSFCPAGIWRNDHASAPPSQEPPSSSMPDRCSTKCTQAWWCAVPVRAKLARRGNDGGRGRCPSWPGRCAILDTRPGYASQCHADKLDYG
jgi:hypothetical protein